MNSGATADRVYEALKQRLLAGAFRPGERLEPALLADALLSSVTPVRDALHRLIGERLIETHSGTGFHLATLNEPDLRDLYAWNAQLLLGAIRWWRNPPRTPSALPADRVEATRMLFHQFGALSGNRELTTAIDGISDRLGAIRKVEPDILAPDDADLERLAETMDGPRSAIGRAVRAYHRRRLTVVADLVRALHRADQPGSSQ